MGELSFLLHIIIVNGVYQSYSSTKSLMHVEAPIFASLNKNHFSLHAKKVWYYKNMNVKDTN